MSRFMLGDFDSVSEIIKEFQRVDKQDRKLLEKAVAKFNDTDACMDKVASVNGLMLPVAAHTMANDASLLFAASRLRPALISTIGSSVIGALEMQTFAPEDIRVDDRDRLNVPILRRALVGDLKHEFAHAICLLKPAPGADGVGFGATVLVCKPTGATPARRRRAAGGAPVVSRSTFPVLDDPLSLARVAAAFWSNTMPERSEIVGGDGLLSKAAYRRLVIEKFVLDALTTPSGALFAYGGFKRLARSLLDELTARNNSLDLGGRAPLQAQGIASFLATLNVDKSGTTVVLPAVKNK